MADAPPVVGAAAGSVVTLSTGLSTGSATGSAAGTVTTVTLRRGRAKPAWFGHPWVFSEAIDRVDGSLAPGDEVRVLDHDGRFIGRGFANPLSQIRVRLASLIDRSLDRAWLGERLDDARALRERLGLPGADTDAYRLVNSEGDYAPGLIVDVYGDAAAVQLTTAAMKRRENDIYELLAERGARTVYEVAAGGVARIEGFVSQARVARGEPRPRVPYRENGLRFEVEPLSGQKTGAFLDQRENRGVVRGLARGARVLDLYSYAGGFALNALAGGAVKVTAIDASERAIERLLAHAADNGMEGRVDAVEADVFRWLEDAPAAAFDLVVCDPPKFARQKKDVEAAVKGYRRLNGLAMATLAPGGLLCTASCSQLVGAEELERIVAAAAKDSHRRAQVLEVRGQARDHVVPAAFPEGRYLKLLVCRII